MPYRLDFDSPWYLLLLAMLPVMWWFGRRSLSGLGRVRKWVVLLLRSAVFVLIVLSLAEIQWVRTNDKLTVIYLLDQSLSIPPERRQAMTASCEPAVTPEALGWAQLGWARCAH